MDQNYQSLSDKTHTCCGDDPAETYSFDYTDGQTYYCNVEYGLAVLKRLNVVYYSHPLLLQQTMFYEPT